MAEEAGDTSGSESLVVEREALSVGLASNWTVDSGATFLFTCAMVHVDRCLWCIGVWRFLRK